MEQIWNFLKSNPVIAGGIGVLILAGIAIILFFIITERERFRKWLKTVTDYPGILTETGGRKYSHAGLLRRSKAILAFADKNGAEILAHLGMEELWVGELLKRKNKKNLLQVLKYAPEKGLFKAFLACLEKPELFPLLTKGPGAAGNVNVMRKIALAGRGEDFDGRKALKLFYPQLDEIREMTGDPEWSSRYFAVKIILHDTGEKAMRALWEGFDDPHPLIRKTLIEGFFPGEREQLFNRLFKIVTADPVYEVRNWAARRIHKQFEDFYKLKISNLEISTLPEDHLIHLIEQLHPGSKDDERFAFQFLTSADLEIRLAAALFLEQCGSLERLCTNVDLGDREELTRNCNLLKNACEVNVDSFLSVIEHTNNPATLLVCAEILYIFKNRMYIPALAGKVFDLYAGNPVYAEIYAKTLECIYEYGDEAALKALARELTRFSKQTDIIKQLLKKIPLRADYFFIKPLLEFFTDPDFPAREELSALLAQFSHFLVLPEVLSMLRSERSKYPHIIRIQALKLLGLMRLPYSLQIVLENLPVLPPQAAREFMQTIYANFPAELFAARIEKFLALPDSKCRAAVISVLPATGNSAFLPLIRKALKEADPDVRIAAVWAITEYEDTKSLGAAVSLLRDPLERVRREAARAIGTYGSQHALEKLQNILTDANEIIAVKTAAIEGLGKSQNLFAIEALLNAGFQDQTLHTDIIAALAVKTEKNQIIKLIEEFKNAEPALRHVVAAVFKQMGATGEKFIIDLLKEDIRSLKPYIAEILETTGGIESIIRSLMHRDPVVRREAAGILAAAGTKAAFRGIVQAARDPDDEVRVKVIKALEILETPGGTEILKALESDPDERVRKYTHWALERLKAKEL